MSRKRKKSEKPVTVREKNIYQAVVEREDGCKKKLYQAHGYGFQTKIQNDTQYSTTM